jgi:hypothetical protein
LSPKRINLIAAIVRNSTRQLCFEFGNYSANTEVPADENIASQCCDPRDVPVGTGERLHPVLTVSAFRRSACREVEE